MPQPNVVIVGHVCIDHNKSEHATYTGWGSSALYMAQSLDTHVAIKPLVITAYGPDIIPYLPVVALYPEKPNQKRTLRYENDTSSGKRVQHCYHVTDAPPPTLNDTIISAIKQADVIIVATLLPNYSAQYLGSLLAHAKPGAVKVLCPQGYFRHITSTGLVEPCDFAEADAVVPQFDLVMYSEEDYPQASTLARTWKQFAPTTALIVTQSANGASIIGKQADIHIPTVPIPPEEIIDSVGCGDTFAAAVAYQYYQTRNLEQAVVAGHQAARSKLLAITATNLNRRSPAV